MAATLRCPHCNTTLEAMTLRSIDMTVHRCAACLGLWFDGGDLDALMAVTVKGLRVPEQAAEGDRRCPRDDRRLWVFRYPHTFAEIDMCRQCHGLWLDHRELMEIKTVRKGPDKWATPRIVHIRDEGFFDRLERLIDAALAWFK